MTASVINHGRLHNYGLPVSRLETAGGGGLWNGPGLGGLITIQGEAIQLAGFTLITRPERARHVPQRRESTKPTRLD